MNARTRRQSPSRPRSLKWHSVLAVCGVVVILIAGAFVMIGLIRSSFGPSAPLALEELQRLQSRAWRILGSLCVLTAAFLIAIFLWIRRRLLGELDGLVRVVEQADPDRPSHQALPPMRVAEFERLRVSFLRFFDRFLASRARQEEAEGTLGHVLDHAADAILVLDHHHRILSWNRGAEETFGYPEAEIVGEPYTVLIPADEEESELQALLAPGSTVKDLRTRRLRRDGRSLDVSLTRSRVPAAEGGEERFVEILRDVSATRRLEEELLRTEKMAAVGKISSKVVHEIRNPLASINLNVDLLRESLDALPGGPADPESTEILGIIKREIRRLSQITEEYLQFSRLPRAAFRPERINDILLELSDLVRPSIARRGIRLVLNLDESRPEAICDATLLRQALLNLLRNAMDATEEGKGQIQMRTRVVEEDPGPPAGAGAASLAGGVGGAGTVGEAAIGSLGPLIEITVEDNGRGILPAQAARIFEPFFTTKKDGTGLGLALVQRAVEEHRGRIQCVSLPGKGTTFRVLIPRRPPAEVAPEAAGAGTALGPAADSGA